MYDHQCAANMQEHHVLSMKINHEIEIKYNTKQLSEDKKLKQATATIVALKIYIYILFDMTTII